jgi:hypothetical protein
MRRAALMWVCAVLLGLGASAPAQGAFDDPLFFKSLEDVNGPCGLTIGSTGQIYAADYYNRSVRIFTPPSPPYDKPLGTGGRPLNAYSAAPNPHTGPVDDPCGLALDSTGALYLNNYHRNVIRFPSPVSLTNPGNKVIDSGDAANVYANPTGVAVDPATNHAYVDDRTYLAEYTSTGVLVQKIGEGTLSEGYGIAVSGFPATAGRLYVPDAASKTVKVYDPATSTINPIASIAKPGGFGSLIDSAIAIDNATGEIYLTDTIGPQLTESPQAIVYVFGATGAYEGRLKHATINAAPAGLAVDNTGGATQGRVYLTSGIAEKASIYAYPAHAAGSASAPPLGLSGGGGAEGSAGASASAPGATAPSSLALAPAPSSSTQSDAPAQSGLSARGRRHRAALRRRAGRHRHRGHTHRAGRDRP